MVQSPDLTEVTVGPRVKWRIKFPSLLLLLYSSTVMFRVIAVPFECPATVFAAKLFSFFLLLVQSLLSQLPPLLLISNDPLLVTRLFQVVLVLLLQVKSILSDKLDN